MSEMRELIIYQKLYDMCEQIEEIGRLLGGWLKVS